MTKVIALTGGIGSGKTTLSEHLKKKAFLSTSLTVLFQTCIKVLTNILQAFFVKTSPKML